VVAAASSQENEIQRWAYLLLFPLAVPAVFLFAPLLEGFFLGLGLTDLGTRAIASLLGASLWLLAPQMEMITRRGRALLPTIALLAGIALLAAGAQLTRYDAAHPKPSNVLYAWSADSGKALWAAQAAKPDAWTSQFLTSSPQQGTLPEFFPEAGQANFLWSEAPAAPLVPPTVQLVESQNSAGVRKLRLRVASPRGARWLALRLPEAEVLSATVNARPLANSADLRARLGKGWMFGYLHAPAAGVELLLEVKGAAPVKVLAIDRSPGLPEIAGASFRRPETTLPIQSGDQCVVSRSFTF